MAPVTVLATLLARAAGLVEPAMLDIEHPLTSFISRPDAFSFIVAFLAGIVGILSDGREVRGTHRCTDLRYDCARRRQHGGGPRPWRTTDGAGLGPSAGDQLVWHGDRRHIHAGRPAASASPRRSHLTTPASRRGRRTRWRFTPAGARRGAGLETVRRRHRTVRDSRAWPSRGPHPRTAGTRGRSPSRPARRRFVQLRQP
jgi:hypothetical protein